MCRQLPGTPELGCLLQDGQIKRTRTALWLAVASPKPSKAFWVVTEHVVFSLQTLIHVEGTDNIWSVGSVPKVLLTSWFLCSSPSKVFVLSLSHDRSPGWTVLLPGARCAQPCLPQEFGHQTSRGFKLLSRCSHQTHLNWQLTFHSLTFPANSILSIGLDSFDFCKVISDTF